MFILGLLLLLGVLLATTVYLQPRPLLDAVAARNPRVLFRVDTTERVMAITIDDGPHPEVTPALLEVLAENDAHATFFILGSQVPGNEHLLEAMVDGGHELANHLMTPRRSILLDPEEFRREMEQTHELLEPYGPIRWLRPGSGWFDGRMLDQIQAQGYRCCLASVHPRDAQIHWVPLLSRYILWKAFPGSILVLHDGLPSRMRTVEVLRRVLPELRRRGYRLVTVSELVEVGGEERAGHP